MEHKAGELRDHRTEEQMSTHTEVICMRDGFLSGWGPCEGGSSFAGWACRPEHSEEVFSWVERTKVELCQHGSTMLGQFTHPTTDPYDPRESERDVFTIYAVTKEHTCFVEEDEDGEPRQRSPGEQMLETVALVSHVYKLTEGDPDSERSIEQRARFYRQLPSLQFPENWDELSLEEKRTRLDRLDVAGMRPRP